MRGDSLGCEDLEKQINKAIFQVKICKEKMDRINEETKNLERRIIKLHKILGLMQEEAAQRMGISRGWRSVYLS
jgi:predicted DNA-binding protein (UPF0251 family)